MNLRQVCFECAGDRYGAIPNFFSESHLVASMKFVYREGAIRLVENVLLLALRRFENKK